MKGVREISHETYRTKRTKGIISKPRHLFRFYNESIIELERYALSLQITRIRLPVS